MHEGVRVFEALSLGPGDIFYLRKKLVLPEKTPNAIEVQAFSPKIAVNPSDIVYFDPRQVAIHSMDNDFLFGQLLIAHDRSAKYFTPEAACFTYRDLPWTRSTAELVAFFELGIANRTMMPFRLSKDGRFISMLDPNLLPTMNTFDPQFREWVEQYKLRYKPKFRGKPAGE